MTPECGINLENGKNCTMPSMHGYRRCYVHENAPEIRARRLASQAKERQNRRRYVPKGKRVTGPLSLYDIRDLMLRTVAELGGGRLDNRSGLALAFACQTAIRAHDSWSRTEGEPNQFTDLGTVELEIRALKELAKIAREAGLRHDTFIRQLHEYVTMYRRRSRRA